MAKSKYAGIVDKLPRSFAPDEEYQVKVNKIKAVILNPELEHDSQEEISSAAVDIYLAEIEAMQMALNNAMIRSLGPSLQASRLARIFRDLRAIKAMFDEQEKMTNLLLEAYGQLLVEQYEVEGTTSIKLSEGSSVRVQYEPHGKVFDKDANRLWAVNNGLENSLCLPWQTVNALTKEALLNGEEPPDGVEATSRPKIVYTK